MEITNKYQQLEFDFIEFRRRSFDKNKESFKKKVNTFNR